METNLVKMETKLVRMETKLVKVETNLVKVETELVKLETTYNFQGIENLKQNFSFSLIIKGYMKLKRF